jgi:hypothetical protein
MNATLIRIKRAVIAGRIISTSKPRRAVPA